LVIQLIIKAIIVVKLKKIVAGPSMVFKHNFYWVKSSEKNFNIAQTRYFILRFLAPTRFSILKSFAQTHHLCYKYCQSEFLKISSKHEPPQQLRTAFRVHHHCFQIYFVDDQPLNVRSTSSYVYYTLFRTWGTYAHYTYLLLRIRYGAWSPSDLHHNNNNNIM